MATIKSNVDISYDAGKSQRNLVARGLPFSCVARLVWSTALVREDTRRDYGEKRFFVLGLIDERLHAMVFTPRDGRVHVISLRKANSREVHLYEQTQKAPPLG